MPFVTGTKESLSPYSSCKKSQLMLLSTTASKTTTTATAAAKKKQTIRMTKERTHTNVTKAAFAWSTGLIRCGNDKLDWLLGSDKVCVVFARKKRKLGIKCHRYVVSIAFKCV